MAKAKAKAKAVGGSQDEGTAAVAPVEAVDGVVFVNREKLGRARDIVALVSGKRAPLTDSEADKKDRFSALFASSEADPKGKDAVRFAYELLGGLVRTQAEQDEADEDAAEAQRKFKKAPVEKDS